MTPGNVLGLMLLAFLVGASVVAKALAPTDEEGGDERDGL